MGAHVYLGSTDGRIALFVIDGFEPADAVARSFGCWMCGGPTHPLRARAKTRVCDACDVWELRRKEQPISRARLVTTAPGDPSLHYIDHSAVDLPSPA